MYRGKKFITGFLVILLITGIIGFSNAQIGSAKKTFKTPGTHPTGMTFDGKHIWLADNMTYKIYGIDPGSGKVVKTMDAPGTDPVGLAWDGSLLWCVDKTEKWIYGINIETGIAEKILESNSKNPGGLTFDGEFLWLVDNDNKKILKINTIDGMMHENIPAPSNNAKGLTFDGKYIWVADNGDNQLYRVCTKTGAVITFFGSAGPYPYGVCWDGKTVWNADYQNCELYQIDINSDKYLSKSNPREYEWSLMHDFRNYGPDEIKELDIYMAVPSDLDNQKIEGKIEYEPQPAGFVTDRWGQKFAHFRYENIKSGTFLRPTMKVKSTLYNTEYYIFPERVGSMEEIPAEIKSKYLVDGVKLDINHPLIKEGAKKAVGDEKNPYWIMRKIFDYICAKIEYNLKPLGGWNPAPTVLKRGTGSCSEYTFIFISMCRAVGLPARYAGSVVVRSADKGIDDVWHRWAEVYLPNYGWIPVDVSAGDSPVPARRARYIGVLRNRYLITTKGGGDSEYLDFYYNFNAKWKTKGKCRIYTLQFAEFVPIK